MLIVITFGVYFQNLFHEFTYDDKVMVLEDPAIWQTDIEGIWIQGGAAFWLRQIRTLSFMADYAIFGFSPTGYHLHNLFWHLLCVLLVFFLLKKISQQGTFSFFGALIFAIHPIQVEAVSNITNRKEMLALGFLLIAFLCYIRFLEGTTAGKWGWLLSSVLSWVIATFSKQVAIVLPPLLVAYEFLFVSRDQRYQL
jgi:4-amino-4-deoxy-L-arabinose transferase-like glycosyltransferase